MEAKISYKGGCIPLRGAYLSCGGSYSFLGGYISLEVEFQLLGLIFVEEGLLFSWRGCVLQLGGVSYLLEELYSFMEVDSTLWGVYSYYEDDMNLHILYPM